MTFQRKEWRLPGRFDGLVVVRRVDVRREERDLVAPGPIAATWVDRWYQDERAWQQVVDLYLELFAGWQAPQSPERLNQHVMMRMRRAFDDGELQILGDRPRRMFPLVRLRAPESPPLAPPPGDIEQAETWFSIKVIDDIGDPVDGLDMTFSQGGRSTKIRTNGAGVARWSGAVGTFASVSVADAASLREKMRPRWKSPRTPKDFDGSFALREIEEQIASVALQSETPATMVIKPYFRCKEIPGAHFAFGRSFVLPNAIEQLAGIAEELAENDDRKALIFGHTDLIGSDEMNKQLSERRAKAIFALFTHNATTLEELFSGKKDGPHWQEQWGVLEAQYMLNALAVTDDKGNRLKEHGVRDVPTQQAIKRFRVADYPDCPAEQGPLPPSIYLGEDGRRELFLAYAKRITRKPVEPERFAKIGGASFMGCGEFNPLSLTAKDQESRRAVVFVFEAAAEPQGLPCKLRSTAPCKTQCGPVPKALDPAGKPPYRCKVYQSIATGCPCNGGADLSHDLVLQFPITVRTANKLPHVYIVESEDATIRREKKLASDARANEAQRAELYFNHLPETHSYRLQCRDDGATYTLLDYAPLAELQRRAMNTRESQSENDTLSETDERWIAAKNSPVEPEGEEFA